MKAWKGSGRRLKKNKVLSLAGLAARAGKIASGEFPVEKAVKAGKGHLELRVVGQGQVEPHQPAHDLPGHGGHGGPRHLQPGEAEQAEDKDGVQNQVNH